MEQIVLVLSHEQIQACVRTPDGGVRALYQEHLACSGTISVWEDAVRGMWRKYGLPRQHILLVLPGGVSSLCSFKLPPMRRKRLPRAVRDEIRYSAGPGQIIDYIPDREGAGAWEILACFCQKETLRQFIDMAERLALKLEGITIPTEPPESSVSKLEMFNLYRRYREYVWEERRRRLFRKRWFPAAVAALLCILVWQFLLFRNHRLDETLSVYQSWLDDPKNAAALEEDAEKERTLNELRQQTASIQTLAARLASYPKVDAGLLDRAVSAGGGRVRTEIEGYDSSSGELLIEAESWEAIEAPDYVQALEELGLFQTVSYTGYVFNGVSYTLHLKCILRSGGEGEEKPVENIER